MKDKKIDENGAVLIDEETTVLETLVNYPDISKYLKGDIIFSDAEGNIFEVFGVAFGEANHGQKENSPLVMLRGHKRRRFDKYSDKNFKITPRH